MGGEWGVGAALMFETLPKEGRGAFSGILQEGYAFGSILASGAFALFFTGSAVIGWRGLFMIGAYPRCWFCMSKCGLKSRPCGSRG